MTAPGETRRASRHCGAVVIHATLRRGLRDASRRDCSFCRRHCPCGQRDNPARGSHTAKHYFCKTCGIHPHHQRRSDPTQCSINLGAIDGANPSAFPDIPCRDGVNHSSDQQIFFCSEISPPEAPPAAPGAIPGSPWQNR